MATNPFRWCLLISFVWLCCVNDGQGQSDLPPPCDSTIYCHGELLHTVQMARLFKDSKHFVDMVMKKRPTETQQAFNSLMKDTKGAPTQEQVRGFVNEYFQEPEAAFTPWNPSDWQANPAFLHKIANKDLRDWGLILHQTWKKLGRQISTNVKNNPEKYSQIYVHHPVIVPGGRFKEFYYWDSYWTIEGLLISNMTSTVKGMLDNFLEMVEKYGMVPNGGRIYYTRRSQPPYLIPMVKLYFDRTNDVEYLRQKINLLETEYLFWEKNRMKPVRDKSGKVHKVAQFNAQVQGPRPESYREDYEIAEHVKSEKEKQQVYIELISAAESGWDFSSRWFLRDDDQIGTLKDIKTTSVAPVDLNSMLCYNAKVLAEFYRTVGNAEKAAEYDSIAEEKQQTLTDLFWDEEEGIWHDFNVNTMEKIRSFYISNLHPVWSGCFGKDGTKKEVMKKVIEYLKEEEVLDFVGGMPTSLKDSKEQWDYPNAWAPMQHLVIMGLHQSRDLHPEAETLAFNLAQKWVQSNYAGYQQTNGMSEKYDVNFVGKSGGGGEYEVVLGFGWTNGVDLKMLDIYGDKLMPTKTTSSANDTTPRMIFAVFLACLALGFRLQM